MKTAVNHSSANTPGHPPVRVAGDRMNDRQQVTTSGGKPQPAFPFTAIVGQEELKLSLLLCVTDPTIGGVLVMGHRGTAKSTAVRSLAALLPPLEKVAGCPYGCDPKAPSPICPHCAVHPEVATTAVGSVPVVDLPLGATEDRLAGSLDVERALVEGVQAFAPGLLARANRGFLYIDEVNLLEDHLVDLLLDVAASGVNVVEREGISIRHPARFVLVGSGNPEEGDLRPQLLDRFGLHARIATIADVAERVEIVRRRRAYDQDPLAFAAAWEPEQEALRQRILQAQAHLPQVDLTDETIEMAARLCVALAVDGHRGELTLCRAAVALAALDSRSHTTPEDIARVATLSLQHRLRKDPLEAIGDDERVVRAVNQLLYPEKVKPVVAETAVLPQPALEPIAVQAPLPPPPEPVAREERPLPTFAPEETLHTDALADLLRLEADEDAWSEDEFDDLWSDEESTQ